MKEYHADVTSQENHYTIYIGAENEKAALRCAASVVNMDFPDGYDVVRLWGDGKLLWTADEGWLPEHDKITS